MYTYMYVKKCCDNDGMLRCTPAGSFNGPKVIGRGSPCVTIGWSWTRHPSARVHCITHPLFWVGLHEHLREKPANPAWGPQGFLKAYSAWEGEAIPKTSKGHRNLGWAPWMCADSTCQDSQPSVLFLGELQSDPQQSMCLKHVKTSPD